MQFQISNIPTGTAAPTTVEQMAVWACDLLKSIYSEQKFKKFENDSMVRHVSRDIYPGADGREILQFTIHIALDPGYTVDRGPIWKSAQEIETTTSPIPTLYTQANL